jgi:hypothetical protein
MFYLFAILDDFSDFGFVETEKDAGGALQDPSGTLDQFRPRR